LDRVSMVQVLPGLGFTLWNPPPACSLALLLIKGLRFAPALFPAAVLADGINTRFSIGVMPTLVTDVIVASGYSMTAVALRGFVHSGIGFKTTRAVASFLVIVFVGVLVIAMAVCSALRLMGLLRPDEFVTAVRHFWIGDVTGIVGLLPALVTALLSWQRWQELSARTRCVDLGVFVLALASALWLVFGIVAPKEFQFFYLLLLPMIWIGVRHGLPWCALAILIEQSALIAVIALHDYSSAEFTDFQLLSLAIAITGLLLGTVVTEQHRTELQLRQQQAELSRMARVTTAAALGSAIVHEVSQPLAVVSTYAHACRLMLTTGSPEQGSLTTSLLKLELEALRAGEIVERLRDFLAKGDTRFVPLDLGEVVRVVVRALDDEA
jgi:two-component system, LuxR family, sensor kinase FixL